MRKQFVECDTAEQAADLCPWAGFFLGAEGGFWCFESEADYVTASNQV